MTQDSQENRSAVSIYISTGATHFERAQLVQAQLEGEGYSVWIGDKRTEDDWQNIRSIVEDALRFADASVLLVLTAGDPLKIEAARQRHLPVLLLTTDGRLSDVLAELKLVVARIHRPDPVVFPSEIDSDDAPNDSNASTAGFRKPAFHLVLALLLNLPVLFVMLLVRIPDAPIPLDWIQILLFAIILSISGWAYGQESNRL